MLIAEHLEPDSVENLDGRVLQILEKQWKSTRKDSLGMRDDNCREVF